MDTRVGQTTVGELLPIFILILVLLFFLFFCIKTAIATSKSKAKGKQKRQELITSGVKIITFGKLVTGLALPEGTFCNIYEYDDKFVFI
ncbi:MAG: hypothetical protein Q4C73_03200 [Eubacteriales bacterium]|nr:hypothetical protein [Eubacteriales bacterium]